MKHRTIFPHIIFVILVILFVLLNNLVLKQDKITQSSSENNQKTELRNVVKVSSAVDGDTIKVLIANKEDIVRLIGIDSPEFPDDCFAKEASDKAKELVNKTIILESDLTQSDRDEYGRLLRYVFLEDGTNFNKLMISEGYARKYVFKNKYYKYQSEFENLQTEAQKNKRGLWADNACN